MSSPTGSARPFRPSERRLLVTLVTFFWASVVGWAWLPCYNACVYRTESEERLMTKLILIAAVAMSGVASGVTSDAVDVRPAIQDASGKRCLRRPNLCLGHGPKERREPSSRFRICAKGPCRQETSLVRQSRFEVNAHWMSPTLRKSAWSMLCLRNLQVTSRWT